MIKALLRHVAPIHVTLSASSLNLKTLLEDDKRLSWWHVIDKSLSDAGDLGHRTVQTVSIDWRKFYFSDPMEETPKCVNKVLDKMFPGCMARGIG